MTTKRGRGRHRVEWTALLGGTPAQSNKGRPGAALNVGLSGRIKHGDLLRAMRERGWSQVELGRFLGLRPSSVGQLINLQWIPTDHKRNARLSARLFELTYKTHAELWPEWTRTDEFLQSDKRLDLYRDITPRTLADRGLVALPPTPEDVFSEKERADAVAATLSTLSPRQERVVKMRFGLNGEEMTYQEIGEAIGVSASRAYTIERRALRILKHPSRSKRLEAVCGFAVDSSQ